LGIEEIVETLEIKIPFTNITIFNLISAIVVIVVGYIIAVLVSRYIKHAMLKAKMAKILAIFTSRVVKILLIIFVIAIGIGFLGIDVGAALISVSVVSGFVLGFAFQETLGNLAAGFMIAITKPFRVGDYVDIAGKSGSINDVGASITTMTTIDNKRVIIPNSKIWGEPIVNYTALGKRMIDMRVGISYKDNMEKAIKTTMKVLKANKKVLNDPIPTVAVADLGESSVDLLVRPWVNTGDYWASKWELIQQIKEAFDKEKISIPFPQTDVHIFKKNKNNTSS
jgi:small-conductance mechanosensitive channel